MDSEKREKKSWIAVVIVVCVLVTVLFCAGFAILFSIFGPAKTEVITVEKEGIITEEKINTSETLRSGITAMGQLVTASYWYEHAEYYEDSKKIKDFTIPFTTSSFVLQCSGKISAGIDFSKADVDVFDDNKMIVITMPSPEVFSNDIDSESFEVCAEKNSVFNKIEVGDTTETVARIEKDELQKALDKGLLEEAKENASKTVKSFVYSVMTGKDYEVLTEFK
ncbi:MAG: DUF4230 domain-containing protein [Lachnospiraceae bacterium]|nr:DUF4230 domain-containing protein [Lachnospiraceae bacterium]